MNIPVHKSSFYFENRILCTVVIYNTLSSLNFLSMDPKSKCFSSIIFIQINFIIKCFIVPNFWNYKLLMFFIWMYKRHEKTENLYKIFLSFFVFKPKLNLSSSVLVHQNLPIYLKLLVTFIWSGSFRIKTECNTNKNQTICLLGQ